VEISVRDDGPGIAPEKISRVFEPYYTSKEKGSGLGLAIVKNNVELYGGTVRLESELGKGAKFTVIFPAKALPKPFNK
jgi:two-component system NtrC family sensor kinase